MISLEPLEKKAYGAIVADPPWSFRVRKSHKEVRNPDRHYRTMSLEEIEAMPVKDIAARACHLFLWVPGPLLVIGAHLPIMRAWGFKPSASGFVWIKLRRKFDPCTFNPVIESDLHIGLGMTTRKNAEFVVLGRRGSARRKSNSVREVILSPVREHSRKPDEFYRRVEQYCDGPYAELFSREDRLGWHCWGNEAGKFNGNTQQETSATLKI